MLSARRPQPSWLAANAGLLLVLVLAVVVLVVAVPTIGAFVPRVRL